MTKASKLLVVGVDDDFRVRESIESLVESAGYDARVFSSAEQFLASGTVLEAACVITDVRMSGMNGIELQRRVRLVRPSLPVIFVSAHQDVGLRQQALDEGAAHFIYKPFDAAKLIEALERLLRQPSND
jgi:FixJ family two-component response regulator